MKSSLCKRLLPESLGPRERMAKRLGYAQTGGL